MAITPDHQEIERRYLTDATFHQEVELAVRWMEHNTAVDLSDNRHLALARRAAAYAVHMTEARYR